MDLVFLGGKNECRTFICLLISYRKNQLLKQNFSVTTIADDIFCFLLSAHNHSILFRISEWLISDTKSVFATFFSIDVFILTKKFSF